MSRRYEPLWNQLKLDQAVQVELPRREHSRVIKAIQRESAEDTAYRFRCVDTETWYTINYQSVGDTLYMSLEFKPGINPRFVITPERIRKRVEQGIKKVSNLPSADELRKLKELEL